MPQLHLQTEIKPMGSSCQESSDIPCCGPPQESPSRPHEKAGYRICPFVDGFVEQQGMATPRIRTGLTMADRLGSVKVRLGICRNNYRIAPGLYCTGNPGPDSPVLVSANYKLSFDTLRNNLEALDSWIIVLDTRGINVWCAAGKKTFSTEEIIRQVRRSNIGRLVTHRELILPQLGAPGVSALHVRKQTGFKVLYGPIRASDLREFLVIGKQASPVMRMVTFTLWERLILIPVEIALVLRLSCILLMALFLLSGIDRDIFSLARAWERWRFIGAAFGTGLFTGSVLLPVLLPWIPGKSFYLKGFITGLAGAGLTALYGWSTLQPLELVALAATALTISSYSGMNFTGATPFTSPSGVEKEMRRGIPLQILGALLALAAWISAPFF